MQIKIITDKITVDELRQMAQESFGDFVKGVCDTEKRILALGGELHSDCFDVLVENNSEAKNIWGFNVFPDFSAEKRIDFVSLINIRPSQNNRSMEIQNQEIKEKIIEIINHLILWS
ncbi:MAG: DUF5674 family protein [Candidatus Pacebacteria bacterium]|nr:DUF5674 family protein [Candidatus Paceibacterota bacterium]